MECYNKINNRKYVLFEEQEPNSVFCNKNITQAVADENEKPTLATLLCPMEDELQFLSNKIMLLGVNKDFVKFRVILEATMLAEKLDNARTGKEGTGSNSICML